jgi:hypothetical protein
MNSGAYGTLLTTDSSTNPTFLNSASPVFSFICSDPNSDDCSAYKIEVNSSSDFTGTEYWDSGKVSLFVSNNTRSSNITYTGDPLTNSGNTYYWRITVWDADDLSGGVSSTATFLDSFPSFRFEGLQLDGIQIN